MGYKFTGERPELLANSNPTSSFLVSGAIPLSPNTALEVYRLDRHDPRLFTVEKALCSQLWHQDISHKEGSRVLAKVIIDEYFRGTGLDCLRRFLLDILLGSGTPTKALLDSKVEVLLQNVWEAVQDVEFRYRQDHPECRSLLSYHRPAESTLLTTSPDGCLIEPLPLVETSITSSAKRRSTMPRSKTPSEPFKFLDLPGELRNNVYNELLSPGDIQLVSESYEGSVSKNNGGPRHTVKSLCQPNILSTCKQIYGEAKDILCTTNTVCVTAAVREGSQPILGKKVLPDNVLPKLVSLLLVVDGTRIDPENDSQFFEKNVNWKQLQAMTNLQRLRICFLDWENIVTLYDNVPKQRQDVLEQITKRIPAYCKVAFESRTGFEDEYVQWAIDRQMWWMDPDEAVEVERRELRQLLTNDVKTQQGCISGHSKDYRFPGVLK